MTYPSPIEKLLEPREECSSCSHIRFAKTLACALASVKQPLVRRDAMPSSSSHISSYNAICLLVIVILPFEKLSHANSPSPVQPYAYPGSLETSAFLATALRVRIKSLNSCADSNNGNRIDLGPVRCPCFLRYLAFSPHQGVLDAFFLPESSYTNWTKSNFSGDPHAYVKELSVRGTARNNSIGALKKDTNVFLTGSSGSCFASRRKE